MNIPALRAKGLHRESLNTKARPASVIPSSSNMLLKIMFDECMSGQIYNECSDNESLENEGPDNQCPDFEYPENKCSNNE